MSPSVVVPPGPGGAGSTDSAAAGAEQLQTMKTGSPVFPQASGGTPSASAARRSGTGRGMSLADGNMKEDLIQRHLDVQKEFESLQPLNQKLGKDAQKKKESYVRREVFYKSQISHIKDMLEKTVLCRGSNEASMPAIRNMHREASFLPPSPVPVYPGDAHACPARAVAGARPRVCLTRPFPPAPDYGEH